jgi:hypothetical protein
MLIVAFYFFEQFQIALPPDWIAIILRIAGILTGGCQPIPKSVAAVSGVIHRRGNRDNA